MTIRTTRRALLAGALSSAAAGALAEPTALMRPVPRPATIRSDPSGFSERLVRDAGLSGVVGYAVIDSRTRELLDARLDRQPIPPASTLKSVTALYALSRLGPDHRFETEVRGDGPLLGGTLNGNLILAGGGDPVLDTDRMADLVDQVIAAGVRKVSGQFLVWGGALPEGDRIDPDQPEHVGYNPAFGGLNLNFNRVHFEWKRVSDGYDTSMEARGLEYSPETRVARIAVVERQGPVYGYRAYPGRDEWTVAERALGKGGSRWLPVRVPERYAGDVFRAIAVYKGLDLPPPAIVEADPGGEVIAALSSPTLEPLLKDMLKFSTNLTAEVVGLSASLANGIPVKSLLGSGSRMAGWAADRYGVSNLRFRDHSGLGYGSEIAPGDLASILAQDRRAKHLMKPVNLALDKSTPAPSGVFANAKTGTLNFVSALAGYVTTAKGRELTFAILTADRERRDAIPPEARERPDGARGWASRSRTLQKRLIRAWAEGYGA